MDFSYADSGRGRWNLDLDGLSSTPWWLVPSRGYRGCAFINDSLPRDSRPDRDHKVAVLSWVHQLAEPAGCASRARRPWS